VRPGASQCEVCRRWSDSPLCRDCIGRWAAPLPRCEGCGLSLKMATATRRCGACLRDPPPFAGCRCAVDYVFPWDGLIAAFKYRGRVELATALAARLIDALDGHERGWPELLLPVPLAPARLAERGYNQAWELARRVGARIGRPARADLLLRPLGGPRQARLDRQARRRNLRGSFAVADPAPLAGRRLALVDDVLTTGATAAEASIALLRAGAAAVHVWALARTP
jgi:ComF family protein